MATDTSTTNFAPIGFSIVERLGIGTVFEIAVVRDVRGRELICKRAAQAPLSGALERERDLLRIMGNAALPELVASGTDARGGFLVETRAPGVAVRELMGDGPARASAAICIALASASAHALATLHALGDAKGPLAFIHGDISPDNLFFEPPATVTFVDLSSATWREAPRPALASDRGTAPYAAPERLREESPPTARGDTYALAATLLAVAIGPHLVSATTDAARLLEAGSEGVLWKRIEERGDLPVALRSALAEALQYEQAHRLSSSSDLAARLGALSPPDADPHD